jgi:hypothetical protein
VHVTTLCPFNETRGVPLHALLLERCTAALHTGMAYLHTLSHCANAYRAEVPCHSLAAAAHAALACHQQLLASSTRALTAGVAAAQRHRQLRTQRLTKLHQLLTVTCHNSCAAAAASPCQGS